MFGFAEPELEHKQRPQPVGIVAPSRIVFGEQVPYEFRGNDVPLQKYSAAQVILHVATEAATKPNRQRYTESCFRPSQKWCWQTIAKCSQEDIFSLPATDFPVMRD